MTTAPASPRPAAAPKPLGGGAPGSAAPALDPIKLLRKYKWWLAASVMLGGVLGFGANFILARVAPKYTAEVIFQCFPPGVDPAIPVTTVDDDEMQTFMATQVTQMTSDAIFSRVVNDPRLATEAPDWVAKFPGSSGFNATEALRKIENYVSSRQVPGTTFIRLTATTGSKQSAAGLVSIVKRSYLDMLRAGTRTDQTESKDAIQRSINAVNQEITDLTAARDRIVRDEGLDSIDTRSGEAKVSLDLNSKTLIDVRQSLQAAQVQLEQLERMLASDAGITFTDSQRGMVEQSPLMLNFQQQIKQAEAELLALQKAGIRPGHRTSQLVENQIAGLEQKMTDLREELLRKQFDADLDSTRQAVAQLRAQEAELLTQNEQLRTRLTSLTRIVNEVEDLQRQIEAKQTQMATLQADLNFVDRRAQLSQAARVVVQQDERVPDEISFPKLAIMLPLGVLLTGGLTGAFAVGRELLDQRIKGASDVAMIPRTRVVGVVPDAAEDPGNPASIETVFRDQPRGVLSESYRQSRTTIGKAMQRAGHRTLLVVGAQPGSGSTTTALNLGYAAAAAEQRVLLIDANFRKPRVHSILGLSDGPGVGEILAGTASLSVARRSAGVKGFDIVTAGAAPTRLFERLGGEAMGSLLSEASEQYDLVLVDVAPAIVAGDCLALSHRCDASILVVRAMGEKRGMVARLRNELGDSRAEFLGVIVNAVKYAAGGYLRKNIKASHEYHADAA